MCGPFQVVGAGEQHAAQQTPGLLLVRRDHSGPRLDSLTQRVGAGVEQRLDFLLPRHRDQLAIKRGRHTGRQAAADHQPGCPLDGAADGALHAAEIVAAERRAGLVEVDGETVPVRDGEVGADVALNRNHGDGEPAPAQVIFEPLAGIAPRREDGHCIGAERVNDARGVDAAPARSFPLRFDIGAIFEGEAVDADHAVDGGVDGKGDNQPIILRPCPENWRLDYSYLSASTGSIRMARRDGGYTAHNAIPGKRSEITAIEIPSIELEVGKARPPDNC
jgi:hypothetical protein